VTRVQWQQHLKEAFNTSFLSLAVRVLVQGPTHNPKEILRMCRWRVMIEYGSF
jgi:hypothetical protein